MKKFVGERQRGLIQIIPTLMGMLLVAMLILGLAPTLTSVSTQMSLEDAKRALALNGYTVYANPSGDFYVNNLLPNSNGTYSIGAFGNDFAEGYFGTLKLSRNSPLTFVGDAKNWIEFRPDLDPTKLAKNSIPSTVERGIAFGYGLPVGGADEELYYSICIPNRGDGESDMHMHIYAWLDTAQDEAIDAVKLQLDWGHVGVGDILSDINHTVMDEVVTGIVV